MRGDSNNKKVKSFKEIKKKYQLKAKKSILVFGLSFVLLGVSTYAWFIGMKTVRVSSFNVQIAAIDGLSLSLTGAENSWSDNILINENNYKRASYDGNTNSWSKGGLIPMSSVGEINETTGRLVLYEKGSYTATAGGYRVMASKTLNDGLEEAKGYVVFDLFIRNLSGNAYYENVNVLNEEAIYLSPDSTVKVSSMGTNDDNSGIQNSVRVAFAQIGRVRSDADQETIVDIGCTTDSNVSGICGDRLAQIWEPNDKRHVKNAINWYKTSCKKRTAYDIMKSSSYSGECPIIEDGKAVPTYAIAGEIEASDRVDIYDGQEFNGYTSTISSTIQDGKLYKYPYFTDSMKDIEGVDRPQFMTLAPNSITKVRIYVYLEGQDIDNYDFASLGKKVSVTFGFSKERVYGEDVDYNEEPPYGPSLDPEVQERPRLDSAAYKISSLCENTDSCEENSLVKDPYGNIRYVGSNPNNYISFNGETWRIVGVFNVASKEGGRVLPRVKIVRSAPFDQQMSWDSSSDGSIEGEEAVNGGMGISQWGESVYEDGSPYEGADLMQFLNGYYMGKSNVCAYCNINNQRVCPATNDCNGINPISSTYSKYVDNAVWYLGTRTQGSKTSLIGMYDAERGTTTSKICPSTSSSCNDKVERKLSWVGKVGLLYPSDFGFASKNANCKNDLYGSDSTCDLENWLHPTSGEYYTITGYPNASYTVNIYAFSAEKSLSHFTSYSPRYVLPTLYLKYGTKIIGNGGNTSDTIYKIIE